MKKHVPFDDQPATRGDLSNFAEHIGILILDSEKRTKSELRGEMNEGHSRLEEKIDKLTDAVQQNTYHIKLLLPIIKVVADLKAKVYNRK